MVVEQHKTGWGDLKKIVVTAIITAVSTAFLVTPAVYLINEYLTKDNIYIDNVSFIPETTYFSLSQVDYDSVMREYDVSSYLLSSWRASWLMNKAVYGLEEYETFRVKKNFKGLNSKEIGDLIKMMNGFLTYRKYNESGIDDIIYRLENHKKEDDIKDIIRLAISSNFGVTEQLLKDEIGIIPALIRHFDIMKRSRMIVNNKVSSIIDKMTAFKQERTGLMTILVILVNF